MKHNQPYRIQSLFVGLAATCLVAMPFASFSQEATAPETPAAPMTSATPTASETSTVPTTPEPSSTKTLGHNSPELVVEFPLENDIGERTCIDRSGLGDYEEMVLWRDSVVEVPLPHQPLTSAESAIAKGEAEEAAQRQIAAWAERREQLAPFIIPPLATKDGSAASTQELAAEQEAAIAALAARLRAESLEGARRAEDLARRLGIDTQFTLPDGRVAVLSQAPEGIPDFNVSYDNVTAVDTISVDEVLKSGESSKPSLSGTDQTQTKSP